MSIPHPSSSSATSRDDDVTEKDDVTEDDDVTEEDDVNEEPDDDKVDVDAADVTTASDVIEAVVSVITLLAVSPKAIVVAVTASFFDNKSSSNFAAFFSSSSFICPSLIWASLRWKKEPADGKERGADTTRRWITLSSARSAPCRVDAQLVILS